MRKFLSLIVAFFLLTSFACADSVRGTLAGYATSESTAKFTAGDLVAIDFDEFPELVAAYVIEISIPEAVRQLRGAYAVYVYRRVSPRPDVSNTRYSGLTVDFFLIPPSSRFSVLLPLVSGFRQENSIDTITVDRTFIAADFPVIVSILPIMKGIPSGTKESIYELYLRPVYREKGALVLRYSQDQSQILPFELLIDDTVVSSATETFVLDPGFHKVSLISGHYANKTLSVAVEKGLYSSVTVPLEPLKSLVTISAPDAAIISLDGKALAPGDRSNLHLEPGDHTVLIRIGDYSLSRSFAAKPGESYLIELEMDISILPHTSDE